MTLLEPRSGETRLGPQNSPGDTRILTPDVDAALRNVGFQFVSPTKLVVRARVENVTADLDFAQPFFFTLNSASDKVINASAPLVTDQQLGGDGVLSPGEKSARFRFEVTFKENKPFTFLVDASAVVLGETNCTDPVVFPDPNLEAAVRDALNKPSGDVTCADIRLLTELIAVSDSVEILEGLQFAVNLTTLDLADDALIRDLTPLQRLTNLTRLDLGGNDISDISALVRNSGLGSGDTVDLGSNPLSPQALVDVQTLRARGVTVDL